jgi:hypothetical protein
MNKRRTTSGSCGVAGSFQHRFSGIDPRLLCGEHPQFFRLKPHG